MIDAYRAGIPGNGKPVPDGAKMAIAITFTSSYCTAIVATA
jgi:hypothetical protein